MATPVVSVTCGEDRGDWGRLGSALRATAGDWGQATGVSPGRFMHRLATAYTVYFNLRHRQAGHLFQGRYKAKPVEGDAYLLQLMRYVHLNPVFTGAERAKPPAQRVAALRAYRWSSYGSYTGSGGAGFVSVEPLLEMMGEGGRRRQRAVLARYVEAAIAETDELFIEALRASPFAWATRRFGTAFKGCTRRRARRASPRMWPCGGWAVRRRSRGGWFRPVLVESLARHAGLTQRAVAEVLGLRTGKAVSVQVARVRAMAGRDRALAERLARIARALEK